MELVVAEGEFAGSKPTETTPSLKDFHSPQTSNPLSSPALALHLLVLLRQAFAAFLK
jgi:hypothetical protein